MSLARLAWSTLLYFPMGINAYGGIYTVVHLP